MKPINIVMAACALSWFGTGAAQNEASQTEASEEQAQQGIPATPHQQEVLRETTSNLFERLDADGDGSISREEAEADLSSRWAEYDQDGDGKLSEEEFSAFEQRATSLPESEAPEGAPREPAEGDIPASPHQEQVLRDDPLEQLDTDGDGAISRQEAQSDERLRTEWDELDRNEDGELDESELTELEE